MLTFLRAFEEASASRDFDEVAEIHPDAIFRFTDGDFRGRDAIRLAFEKTWAWDVADERYYLTNLRVLAADTHSASVTYDFHWTGAARGRPFHTVGRGTAVVVLVDGKPQLIHEHLSHFPDE